MFWKLNKISGIADLMTVVEFQIQINKWDEELMDYMHTTKNQCCKFKMCHINYSPEVNC